jgi:hypothetical protein
LFLNTYGGSHQLQITIHIRPLCLDNGNIRFGSREKNNFLTRKRAIHLDVFFPLRKVIQQVGTAHGMYRGKWKPHRSSQEPGCHGEVTVILPFHFSLFHSFAKIA